MPGRVGAAVTLVVEVNGVLAGVAPFSKPGSCHCCREPVWEPAAGYDAAALFRAALSHDEGGLDDQDLSGRLMRLAVDQKITDVAGSDRPISMWKSRCSQLVTATANPA